MLLKMTLEEMLRQWLGMRGPHRKRRNGEVQLLHEPHVQHALDTVSGRLLQPLLHRGMHARARSQPCRLRPMRGAGQAKHLRQAEQNKVSGAQDCM